ncbi:sensor protein CitS [Ruminiclostridium hungatei]|uniref:Sensor protein CitS n=1 Tax=Ruminiclostridium hungatei TaxID=48256 RepID=A0A1V4SFX8_RUMHU|nr:sensor protein CitS [Ruminiclostridium hungatei]
MAVLYTASEIIFTAIEGLIVIITFSLISNHTDYLVKNFFRTLLFTVVYTSYSYLIPLFIPLGVHSVLIFFITVLIINYLFKERLMLSFIRILPIFIAMSIIEVLISLAGMLIYNIPIETLLQNDLYVFICSIIAKTVEIAILFLLKKSPINSTWLNDDSIFHSRYKQILIGIATILFFITCANVFFTNNPQLMYNFNIFSYVIYIILMLAMISAFREGSKLELLQYANEMQKENIQQLIDFNEMVAKERHEYKNHLNTIYGLCTLNKLDTNERIKQYINNYANNSSTKNIFIDSGNDFVDAIINVKYNSAIRKGIELRVDFGEPLLVANIREDVAVTIISNIIENAFEAMSSFERENKYVLLKTYIHGDKYFIPISNNGPAILESEKTRIFNAGYSTKDNPSKTRGFGLSIVKNEVARCNGDIRITSIEEITEFLISFEAKPSQAEVV